MAVDDKSKSTRVVVVHTKKQNSVIDRLLEIVKHIVHNNKITIQRLA